ncbi:hypothetical protein DB346_09775 [Verrucomicrobia bacterium LW23]|nr:hypothetical protein DB346_09775 [Verrucomicrobia bacterium LW23]
MKWHDAFMHKKTYAPLCDNASADSGLEPRLLDSKALARFLGCSERNVFNLRTQGMPHLLIGDLVRFDLAEVRHWLAFARVGQWRPLQASC